MLPTLGFIQVGLDMVISTISKSLLQFGQTNNYQLLNITSTIYFNQQLFSAEGKLIPNLHKALPFSIQPKKRQSSRKMKELEHVETERTIMRKLTKEDAKDFYALNLDKEVLKYTGDKPFENIQASIDFLTNYDQYQKYGVGRLAVIEKSTSKFIGWCGLKYDPDKDEYDIGFRFFRDYWNKGFASETAKSCLDFGFKELGIHRIVGRAMKENIASIKVLEKIEMTFNETFDFDGHEGVIYELTKNI